LAGPERIMNVILSFLPLFLFPIVSGFLNVQAGIEAALAAAVLVLGLDWRASHGSVKVLNLGTVVLFGILALIGIIVHPLWNDLWVRLVVNTGFLAIVLFTIVSGRPFTLQYARAQVAKEFWNAPGFIATNFRITWVWAGAFLVSVLADLSRIFVPGIPAWLDSSLGIGTLVAAGWFTSWYPKHVRALYALRSSTEAE
jgi:intracellular septation protein A